jgi:hypothetical protein
MRASAMLPSITAARCSMISLGELARPHFEVHWSELNCLRLYHPFVCYTVAVAPSFVTASTAVQQAPTSCIRYATFEVHQL